jgi:hypothetical protein
VTLRNISEHTPVTIGLAGGLLVIAFWGGNLLGSLTSDVAGLKAIAEKVTHAQQNHETRLSVLEGAKGRSDR